MTLAFSYMQLVKFNKQADKYNNVIKISKFLFNGTNYKHIFIISCGLQYDIKLVIKQQINSYQISKTLNMKRTNKLVVP